MTQRTVTTDSGEVLGSTAIGDPVADRLVILFPPTPGAGGFDPDPLVTSRWGVQVVTLDRPGYAATPAPPVGGPATLDAVVDGTMAYLERVERTADRVSKATFDRIGVIGWGEGGAYAAALAGRHPERVDRLVLVGTPRPSARGPYATRDVSRAALRITDEDPNLALPGVGDRLDRMLEQAGLQGTAGVRADAEAIEHSDWGRWLGSIEAETLLVYGEQDPLVEVADGRWIERRIGRAWLDPVAATGLLAIVDRWEEIVAHVAPNHGRVRSELRDSGALQIEHDPTAWSADGD